MPGEEDQAAMLQSSLLHKGETSDSMVAEESGRRRRRRRRRRGKKSWGREIERTYCSNSYDGQNSRRAAKRACKKDDACGGIYQPENDPGKWFLCKGFNTYSCNSNSVVIEKLSSSSPSPSPSSPSYDDNRRRSSQSSSSTCWGSQVSGYCSGSYGGGVSRSEAESECIDSADCGGIYEPGTEPGNWYLCKDFNVFTSTSGSQSIRKECDATPSPSPSYDDDDDNDGDGDDDDDDDDDDGENDDRRRRGRYPSPSPSASCWGSEQAGYCSGSHGGPLSQSDAESACMRDGQCGGIYQPGAEPGQWYLCKDFDVYASSSGSRSIKKECDTTPSLSPSQDDDRRRRGRYPSPTCIFKNIRSTQKCPQRPWTNR